MTAGPPLVSLRSVAKSYPSGTLALAGLDLVIGTGELLTLLGPSGCGKSTALRLVAGLARPSSGTVAWHEGRQPDIGFVFQEPTLMPWASVSDNVWLPLRLKGVARSAALPQVAAALRLVGLADFARAFPRELSGGMRMRVSIARALVLQPPILLMDEPFAALDEITRLRLNDDLLRLKAELGTTIVFVTHSVYESVYLSTRIAVLSPRPGRIVDVLEIDEPMPRTEEFRLSPAYAEHCRRTSAALRHAMTGEVA